MKKLSILLILSLFAFMVPSCHFYKDQIDELYSEVDSLKASDSALRLRIEQLNSSLTTLKDLVSAMQSGLYIKSVVTLTGDTEQSGYLITMSNGVTYTIRNGRDGQDGVTPKLGVRLGPDGAYYWTLDGEYLRDEEGRMVRADGATPLFDIRDGFWYLSLDGGNHWENLGRASGADGLPGAPGDQLFKLVDYTPGENVVRFVLSDDTSITLPCYQPIAITFNVPDNQTSINSGETIKVDYSLSYGDDKTVVTASSDGNYIVNVQARDALSGSILITCPGLYLDGHVNVMAFDGVGYATVAVITFYEKQMTFGTSLSRSVSTEGGVIEIPVHYNFGYTLEPVGDALSWISVISTRAEMEAGTIRLNVARNDGDPRVGKVYVVPENSVSGPFAVITISQDGAYFELGESSFIFGSAGGNADVQIRTSKQFSVTVPTEASSWVQVSTTKKDNNRYQVHVSVGENTTGAKRFLSIPIQDSGNGALLGSIELMQLTGTGNKEMDMVFEVSANESNDYTVYLPVNGNGGNEFTVDWGDGTYDLINSSVPEPDKPVFHVYQRVGGVASTYRVTLSGTIRRLNSDMIPAGLRSGIASVIQWGHTGLVEMYHAFNGNTRLVSLPADETLAFGEVESFSGAFSDCPRLTQISPDLFAAAKKGRYFDSIFSNCENLQVLPERLFGTCLSAETLSSAFYRCRNLVSVPSRLFCCENATEFSSVFRECEKLTTIPAGLFLSCSRARSFSLAFYACRNLKTIPEHIFDVCPEVTDFSGVFAESGLQSIPANLFAKNPKVERFDSAFRSCQISSIPARLFNACPSVSNMDSAFAWCNELKTVPTDLFSNLRKISNFNYCFCDCWQWKGESPYTLVGGRKVHLYERANYPDYFVTPTYHDNVFSSCSQLTDYASVPSNWR